MISPHAQSRESLTRRESPAWLLALVLVISSCSKPPEKPLVPLDPSKAIKEISTQKETPPAPTIGKLTRMPLGDLYQLVQNNAAVIYDVRPTLYYKMGHIPNAISWPVSNYDRDIAQHEPRIRAANSANTPVVIYCTDFACPDALKISTKLINLGMNISILQGGYEAWKLSGQ